jgi:outer membrane receptor for ferric coprogen and ferric-rhodotorulic acid
MKPNRLTQAIVLSLIASQNSAFANENQEAVSLPSIEVEGVSARSSGSSEQVGGYSIKNSGAATRLDLSVKDTPQSVTVLTREVLDDFGLDTLNDALDATPSVTVERTETDRTYYTSRGFAITNFQVDSLSMPTAFDYPLIQGDVDTAVYDRIETLRGANGLLTGTGNPAATINYIRKRPTDEFQGSVKASVGSWDKHRGELDASGSLNDSGTLRGRVVAAYEDKDSYLDRYEKQREVFYGVMDYQINDNNVLTVGHTYQKDDPTANLWGALPLTYTNGEAIDYRVGDSTAQDWGFWTTDTNNTFVELKSEFGNGWQSTAQLTRIKTTSDGELNYLWGFVDQPTDGIAYFANKYYSEKTNYVADVFASGPFQLEGKEHELVVGAQWAKSDEENKAGNSTYALTTLTDTLNNNIPRPDFGEFSDAGDTNAKQKSVYSAANFTLTDNLNLIAGARYIDYDIQSTAYGASNTGEANEWIPYLGTVYALTDRLNAYASFTQIYQPQSKVDNQLRLLEPAQGQTFEVGLKQELNDGKAIATLALFKTEQDNLAESAGYVGSTQVYSTVDVQSKGIELDLMGEVYPGLNVIGGYTYIDVEDKEGERAALYIPKQSFKLGTTYQLASAPNWKIGAKVKWQSEVENSNPSANLKQGSYAVWDANAIYNITPNLTAQLNVYNIFDKQYYMTYYNSDGQSYYAAPRSVVLSAKYKF